MSPIANVAEYPLAAPSLSGADITVDMMLNEPTRITRFLSDITMQRLWANRVFTPTGTAETGYLIYDQLEANQLYPDRDVQELTAGAELPIITSSRPTPKLAVAGDLGGKIFILDAARRRNDQNALKTQLIQLGNAITRRVHAKAIATLDAELAARPALLVAGHNWSTVVTTGSSATSAQGWPAADLAMLQMLSETDELGVMFDTLVVNPAQAMAFQLVYGNEAQAVLRQFGIDEMISTPRVAAGTAFALESGTTGEMKLEVGLSTETWREAGTRRTWSQSFVAPVFAVTNPYSVRKLTGLAG